MIPRLTISQSLLEQTLHNTVHGCACACVCVCLFCNQPLKNKRTRQTGLGMALPQHTVAAARTLLEAVFICFPHRKRTEKQRRRVSECACSCLKKSRLDYDSQQVKETCTELTAVASDCGRDTCVAKQKRNAPVAL